jgi:hypothetical protein
MNCNNQWHASPLDERKLLPCPSCGATVADEVERNTRLAEPASEEQISARDKLIYSLIAYDKELPAYDGALAKWHNKVGNARTDTGIVPPIDASLGETIKAGGIVLLGRGALREIIKQLKDGRAALDVYAFTLEFVLLMEGIDPDKGIREGMDGALANQIRAARDAYKEVTGDDPQAMYRRSE